MEQWEKDLRDQLDKELPEGYYNIDSGEYKVGTGKDGYIEYQVAIAKEIDGLLDTYSKEKSKATKEVTEDLFTYGEISEEDLEKKIKEVFYGRSNKENN